MEAIRRAHELFPNYADYTPFGVAGPMAPLTGECFDVPDKEDDAAFHMGNAFVEPDIGDEFDWENDFDIDAAAGSAAGAEAFDMQDTRPWENP